MTTINPEESLVIYHGGCSDGLAGAWCFWTKFFNKDQTQLSKLYPGTFGSVIDLAECRDKVIFFVDFTYPKDVTESILKVAKQVVVLDHHKTALPLNELKNDNLTCIIDMERSGSQLGWDYCNGSEPRPWFIDDIADRDLWKWSIEDSKHTTKCMFAGGFYQSLEDFDKLVESDRASMITIGKCLNRAEENNHKIICKRALECLCHPPKGGGPYKVKVVETDHFFASDVGNLLSNSKMKDGSECDFAVICRYSLKDNEWWLSLRAGDKSNIDLTEVAKGFDKGGGHRHACGITLFCSKGQSLDSVFKVIE